MQKCGLLMATEESLERFEDTEEAFENEEPMSVFNNQPIKDHSTEGKIKRHRGQEKHV